MKGADISEGDPLEGPAPIRLTPKIRARERSAAGFPRYEPPDREADMLGPFVLSGPASRNPPIAKPPSASPSDKPRDPMSPSPDVRIEAVLLGNLPGVSGPWMTQYAHLLAQSGPSAVALLRLAPDHITLDLIGPDHTQPPLDSRGIEGMDLVDLLDALVRSHARPVRTLLIHDETWAAAAPSLARLLVLDHWTVLCGADNAAVAGVRQLLASLVQADSAALDKRLGVMMMGSGESVAGPAGQRLCGELADQLGHEVRWLGSHQRIEPVTVRSLGVFSDTAALWPRLATWICAAGDAKRPVREAEANAATHSAQEPAAAAFSGDVQPPHHGATRLVDGVQRPLQDVVMGDDADADAPNLFALMNSCAGASVIPGGIALEAQCPRQPHTQLVLDQTGRLHLLHQHRTHAAAASAAVGGQAGSNGHDRPEAVLRAAIVELMEARQWVVENMKLLELTQRQLRFAPDMPPQLHLFTDRAELTTALIARLGDTVKLHLLKRISVGAAHTWFCTPLS